MAIRPACAARRGCGRPRESVPAFCRDCLTEVDGNRCATCSSARIVSHAKLFDLTIAHIDCDAFYASVEKRDRPELAARPLIVGGGVRGVVTAACYVARIYGVRSAMPMFKGLKACPDAVVTRPDFAKYVAVGRQIGARMVTLTPLLQPLSIDEAVTGPRRHRVTAWRSRRGRVGALRPQGGDYSRCHRLDSGSPPTDCWRRSRLVATSRVASR